MNNVFILTLLISFVFVAFFVAPFIGLFVYKHAVSHNIKNPFLWALIGGLTPFYIGLVIYVLKVDHLETVAYDENNRRNNEKAE